MKIALHPDSAKRCTVARPMPRGELVPIADRCLAYSLSSRRELLLTGDNGDLAIESPVDLLSPGSTKSAWTTYGPVAGPAIFLTRGMSSNLPGSGKPSARI